MKLQQISSFTAIARQAKRNQWFDCFWQEIAPTSLSRRVRVLNVRDAVLVLAAEDAAAATQARFQAPSWITAINTAAKTKNLEGIRRIEVRVAPSVPPAAKPQPPARTLSPATRQHLLSVAEHIDDPRLAAAFRRLAQIKTPAGDASP